ncbi:hypothetical protein [Microtetraspora sp. NBRC 16547]|nr:hypothetical protein [Microtetraspora sp. NBRC 16547]
MARGAQPPPNSYLAQLTDAELADQMLPLQAALIDELGVWSTTAAT